MINTIIRRQQKEEELNKLTIKNEIKPEAAPVAVTISEVNYYDNKRELTESPATTIFNEIERIRDQQSRIRNEQSKIEYEQQSIYSRIKDLRNKFRIFDGGIGSVGNRFGFFRDYIDRFSSFVDEKLRTIIEFGSQTQRKEEKAEQKQEIKQQKREIKKRPRLGG
ncbi:MAG: hypothetical protein EOM50_18065 [Erysipelotrichia bacterium]|nr:hypothetical protein [Erysipelotrichia bacterium]